MGKELTTNVKIGAKRVRCDVYLEGTTVVIRGDVKRAVPRERMGGLAVSAEGVLTFEDGREKVSIELGKVGAAWHEAIVNPRTRVQKLGVTPGMKVCVLGAGAEPDAIAEVEAASGAKAARRLGKEAELVLFFVREVEELAKLEAVEAALAQGGAAWALWPKGRKDLRHEEVVAAAKRAGLSQTKSMGFSEEFSGLRLVRKK